MVLRQNIEKLTSSSSILIRQPLVGILLLSIVGGFIPTLVKIALHGFDSWSLLAVRFLAATFFLFPLVDRKHRSFRVANQLKYISLAGFSNPLFLTLALGSISASIVPIAYALTPFFVYVASICIKAAKVSYRKIIALASGIVGVSIVALGDKTVGLEFNMSVIFLGMGVAGFSSYLFLSQKSKSAQELPAIVRAFHFCLLSAVGSTIMATQEILSNGFKSELNIMHVLVVLLIGFVATGWQYSFMQAMVEHQSSVVTSLSTLTQPIIGISVAVIILSEPVTTALVYGSAVVLVSVYLFTKSQRTN